MNHFHRYDEIIHLPHPVSQTHPRMGRLERAAQFSPFAALTGYDDAVRETARLTDAQRELAEDEQAMREVLTDYFTAKSGGDFTVVSAPGGDTALHLIETRRFDLLLLDINMPRLDGFGVL